MYIGMKIRKWKISELLAIAAMMLLLIHIADGLVERSSKHGFLPMSVDKVPFSISNFGISSIILFFLAFGFHLREKKATKVTTTLLMACGALIGTTALVVSAMDQRGMIVTFLTVSIMGYVIMGLGILRAIQQKKYSHIINDSKID